MKDIFNYTKEDLYELMKSQGDKRFGSICEHDRIRNGKCENCLRSVVVKK